MSNDEKKTGKRQQDWSVMVYLAGDNNLSEEMVWALQEMNEYFWQNRHDLRMKLAVQFDALGAYPRRYRFPNDEAHPDNQGPDGTLREFSKCRHPSPATATAPSNDLLATANPAPLVKEDILLDEAAGGDDDLHTISLESIAREALLRGGEDPSPPNATDPFSGLESDLATKPADGITPDGVRNALIERLRKVAKYLLDSSSAAAQLQHLTRESVAEHEGTQSPNLIGESAKEPKGAPLRAVILSGHGNGGFGDFLPDSDPGSALSIADIGTFLRLLRADLKATQSVEGTQDSPFNLDNAPTVDILGMDACLMSTLEVCYEVREHAKYIVGAEGFVPMAGWPYQRVLDSFQDDPRKTAAAVVQRYYRYYSDYEDACVSTDISAIDLSRIQSVVDTLSELTGMLLNLLRPLIGFPECPIQPPTPGGSSAFDLTRQPLDELVELGRITQNLPEGYNPAAARTVRNALVLARWYAQSYQWENQVDIWDFCDQLHRFLPPGRPFIQIHMAIERVKHAVDAAVLTNGWSGTEFQHSHGLSVYFPVSAARYAPEYFEEHWVMNEEERKWEVRSAGVRFSLESNWGCFLRAFLTLTRRVRRGQENYLNPNRSAPDYFYSFRRQGMQDDSLNINAFSNLHVRSSGPFNTRSGGPFNTRSGGPFNTRSGGPFNTRSNSPDVNNGPDGYYPTPPVNRRGSGHS